MAKDLTHVDRRSSESLSIKIFPTLNIPRMDSSTTTVYSKVSPEEHQYRYRRWTGRATVCYSTVHCMQYDYECCTHATSVGKNLFLLQGRIMLGVHWQHLAASACMIIITWLLYAAMVVPFLHEQQLYSVSISLCTINLTLLLCTATCDPGILPRRRSQLHEAVQSETYLLKTQFCRICNIVRPSRARHCKFCDNCVDIFDHHCPVSALHLLYLTG